MANKTTVHRLSVVVASDGAAVIVSGAQLSMLQFVREHPGALYEEIAEHIGFDRASVNTYASRLDRAKLVRRKSVKVEGRIRAAVHLARGVNLNVRVRKV